MEIVCGSWKARKDVRCRMGVSAFTIPKNAIVTVKRFDQEHRKILVEAGPRTVDWMPLSFINDFDAVI